MDRGAQLKKEADGYKKTSSWFGRRRPDWLNAAPLYDKAAIAFRASGDLDSAVECYELAGEAHYNIDGFFSSAQMLEKAGQISLSQGRQDSGSRGSEFFKRASYRFREAGEVPKAADCLKRAATALGKAADDATGETRARLEGEALEMLKTACELYEDMEEKKLVLGIETFRAALNFSLKCKRYDEAVALNDRMANLFEMVNQNSNLFKAFLTTIILHLHMNDLVAAKEAFGEQFDNMDYLPSSQCKAAEELIAAWEKRDADGVTAVTADATFNYLEREVARIAKRLDPYAGFSSGGAAAQTSSAGTAALKTSVPEAAAASSTSTNDLFAKKKKATAPKAAQPTKQEAQTEDSSRAALFGGRAMPTSAPAAAPAAPAAATAADGDSATVEDGVDESRSALFARKKPSAGGSTESAPAPAPVAFESLGDDFLDGLEDNGADVVDEGDLDLDAEIAAARSEAAQAAQKFEARVAATAAADAEDDDLDFLC